MLKLKELQFSGIGRFVEEQNVDFESLGNLVQVDALNNNTGGSSGSGKSTLFNALDYLLGLNDLPTTVLQSRLTKDSMSVCGIFDLDNKSLSITRSKKGLSINLDGEIIEGSSKLSEEKLTEILGMPSHLFRKMLHKRQKEGGFFLNFTPKQIYEFLTDCLNLSDLRKKTQTIEDKIKDLDNRRSILENGIANNNSALVATKDSLLSLGDEPKKEVDKDTIISLKSKYDSSLESYKNTQERLKNEEKEFEKERPQISTPVYDRSTQKDFESRKIRIQSESANIATEERNRTNGIQRTISAKSGDRSSFLVEIRNGEISKTAAIEIANQIKKLRESVCPTCDQQWASAKEKEADFLAKLLKHKEVIVSATEAESKLKALDLEIEELKKQLAPIVDPKIQQNEDEIREIAALIDDDRKKESDFYAYHNGVNQAVLQNFSNKQKEVLNKNYTELQTLAGQVDLHKNVFESAVQKFKGYEEAKQRYDNSLASMKEKEGKYIAEIEKTTASLTLLIKELTKAETLKNALKSYASCAFDDALEVIGDTSTRIIRSIPNMSNATIEFEGTKETKEGKVKEEVNAVISSDGEIGIPIKSLSGGERSSVDLAVDLAVIDFLENKTGKGIDLFILDEPFTGLDTVGIENVLEILKNSNINKRIVIVDHNETVKEMVTDRIIVVRDGQTSTITQ